MRQILLSAALLVAVAAHAAPLLDRSDEMERPVAAATEVERPLAAPEQSFVGHINQVRRNVTNQTSNLVVTAVGFLGVPYRRGGTSAESGFDCSGFVRAMYDKSVGLVLPRRAEEQAAATAKIERGELKPGDLVFFNTMRRTFSHVGIYMGEGKFIHSPRTGSHVRVDDLNGSYWQRRFDGARRVQSTAQVEAAQIGD